MTEEELDRRYDKIVARFPDGITVKQFRQIALESADSEGRIYPHPVDFFTRHSLLIGMWLDGLIENRGGYHRPMRYTITDKGRAAAESSRAAGIQIEGEGE